MSLLMEALRKAEQDKRSQEQAGSAPAAAADAAPAAAVPPPAEPAMDVWRLEDDAPGPVVVMDRELELALPEYDAATPPVAASPAVSGLEVLDDTLPPAAGQPPSGEPDALHISTLPGVSALPYEIVDPDSAPSSGADVDAQEAIEALFDQAEEEALLDEFVRSRNNDSTPPPAHPPSPDFSDTLTLDQSPAAAANLFRARQTARQWLPAWAWAGGGAVLLAAGVLTAWLFWPRAPLPPLTAVAPAAAPGAVVTPAATPAVTVAALPAAAAPAVPAAVPVGPEPAPIQASAVPAPLPPAAREAPVGSDKAADTLPSLQQLQAAAKAQAAAPPPPAATPAADAAHAMPGSPPAGGGAIQVQRGAPVATEDKRLSRAYAAAEQQRGDAAARDWNSVLRERPQDPDALAGLAALELAAGRTTQAQALYQRLLERDPNDVTAQAALVQLASLDPVAGESRIKQLLQQQPEAAHLHFALGNYYARQARWAEAQQAYFKAMSADPAQPDYLYNLAVSLDQLGQSAAARDYYARALAQAAQRPAQFPRAAAEQRLAEIGAAPP